MWIFARGDNQVCVWRQVVDEKVERLVYLLRFEKVGYEGGYILSCADHFFETPIENIEVYVKAARECVY